MFKEHICDLIVTNSKVWLILKCDYKNVLLLDRRTDTVYSFEFAQSYFRPIKIWHWFAQSWIRPFSNFVTQSFTYYSISPVLNSPSGQRTKRAKIKQGRNFPCIQYMDGHKPDKVIPISCSAKCRKTTSRYAWIYTVDIFFTHTNIDNVVKLCIS